MVQAVLGGAQGAADIGHDVDSLLDLIHGRLGAGLGGDVDLVDAQGLGVGVRDVDLQLVEVVAGIADLEGQRGAALLDGVVHVDRNAVLGSGGDQGVLVAEGGAVGAVRAGGEGVLHAVDHNEVAFLGSAVEIDLGVHTCGRSGDGTNRGGLTSNRLTVLVLEAKGNAGNVGLASLAARRGRPAFLGFEDDFAAGALGDIKEPRQGLIARQSADIGFNGSTCLDVINCNSDSLHCALGIAVGNHNISAAA